MKERALVGERLEELLMKEPPAYRFQAQDEIARSLRRAELLEKSVSPRATPPNFVREVIETNRALTRAFTSPSFNLENVLGAPTPVEMVDRMIPSDGHLE